MSYPGRVSLLVCSAMVVLLWLALSFVTAGQPVTQRRHLPTWIVAAGGGLTILAALSLREVFATANQIADAVSVSAVMVAGVFAKWTLEIAADKPRSLHETALAASLLVAPLCALALGEGVLAASLRPGALLLWFANGFFWATLCSDIIRMRTPLRVSVRRKEP